jgi:hypothetical protein
LNNKEKLIKNLKNTHSEERIDRKKLITEANTQTIPREEIESIYDREMRNGSLNYNLKNQFRSSKGKN